VVFQRIRVLILFGGRSAEHEVSCTSARHVAAAMDQGRFEVVPVGITREGAWVLPEASRAIVDSGGALAVPPVCFEAAGEPVTFRAEPGNARILRHGEGGGGGEFGFDVVFPVLHGPYGEDGAIQGLLELADVAYVGSGVLGSAVGMDKEKMKLLFHAAGLPMGDYTVIRAPQWRREKQRFLDEAAWLGFPSFTKPANLGSSVGISRCTNLASLAAGIEAAFLHDNKILVEQAIVGREIECGVIGNDDPRPSVCGEVLAAGDFYDYVSKYVDTESRTVVPAAIPEPVAEVVRKYSVRAFKAVDAAGMARVDFFYQEGGRGVVVNEINTIPGFTAISMFPQLWGATGLDYPDLIEKLFELALKRHAAKRRGP